MTKLTEVLREQNPSLDQEEGHLLAYVTILQASQAYEHPPVFVPEDNEQLQSDPQIARRVAEWMNTAAKVAAGNRRRVLEDGRDVMRSDEEDAISPKEAEPDEEHEMYAPGCTSLEQAKMTEEQAQAQRAKSKIPPRSQTPVDGSSDDDDPKGPDQIWSQSKHYCRRNTNKPVPAAPAPVPMSMPPKPVPEAKASKPRKGQESPEAKASHPMSTRQRASGAGSLRSGGGSGRTDTRVTKGHPSKT
jgi:hypothetical protein